MTPEIERQRQEYKGQLFTVADMIEATKKYKTEEVNIKTIIKTYKLGLNEHSDLNDIIEVIKRVDSADLKHPIIIGDNGEILDGKHRLTKALLLGKKKIKVKYLPEEEMYSLN